MHSDPIADMLTRIRNGAKARLGTVSVPWSGLREKVVELLKREGFIEDFLVLQARSGGARHIEVRLRYDERGTAVIEGIKSISTPGLRRYFGWDEIPRVRNGLGMIVLTTSKGVMTDREARHLRVGGEAICSVW